MKAISRVALVPALLALAVAPGFARHKSKPKAAQTCPACHMTLSTKKTAENPRAVKIGKKTYYCCAGCDMSSLKGDKK